MVFHKITLKKYGQKYVWCLFSSFLNQEGMKEKVGECVYVWVCEGKGGRERERMGFVYLAEK